MIMQMLYLFVVVVAVSYVGMTTYASQSMPSLDINSKFESLLDLGSQHLYSEPRDLPTSIRHLREAVALKGKDAYANQLLGTAYVLAGDYENALKHIKQGLESGEWKDSSVIANYVEVLRATGHHDAARSIGNKFVSIFPTDATLAYNTAIVEDQLRNFERAVDLYVTVINLNPSYENAWVNCLNLLINHLDNHESAERLLLQATKYLPTSVRMWNFFGVTLHFLGRPYEAVDAFLKALQLDPDHYGSKSSLAAVYQSLGKADEALHWYESSMPFKPTDAAIRNNYGALLGIMNRKEEELYWLEEALKIEPNMSHTLINLGGSYQDDGLLDKAHDYLTRAIPDEPSKTLLRLRVAAMLYPVTSSWSQMIMSRNTIEANVNEMLRQFEASPPVKEKVSSVIDRIHFYIPYHSVNDRHLHELIISAYRWIIIDFERITPTLRYDPSLETLYDQLRPSSPSEHAALHTIEANSMARPQSTFTSVPQANAGSILIKSDSPSASSDPAHPVHSITIRHSTAPITSVDPSFRLSGKGGGDTGITFNLISPSSQQSAPKTVGDAGAATTRASSSAKFVPKRKVKIGFMSKFFGIFEPHALLLDGVMRYLPRDRFSVYVLPVARTDGKPLAPSVAEAVDHVREIPLMHEAVAAVVQELQLDILVFADTLSEPMNHFMAHSRMAKIQVRSSIFDPRSEKISMMLKSPATGYHFLSLPATDYHLLSLPATDCHLLSFPLLQIAFWGNPITSASQAIDYFISGDNLEHPFRTRMPIVDEPYTEQVVLLEGQGIWYYKPESPQETLTRVNFNTQMLAPDRNFTRADAGLEEDWFVYFCPQSTFKIHPLYDQVLLEIVKRNPRGHIVLTGGRRPAWTEKYATRLANVFGTEYISRIHLIPRVSSEKFMALLKIADVILHPFPFDGSRTSADGIDAGIPVLMMPSEYLRGRMGVAFLRTMNVPELAAKNIHDYVDIAVKLCTNPSFYKSIQQKLIERSGLIWEDMEYPFAWTKFLSTVTGMPVPTWDEYIRKTDRDYESEKRLHSQRVANRAEFDRVWGEERWLLDPHGVARLETFLNESVAPQIFNNWTSMVGAKSSRAVAMATSERRKTLSSVGLRNTKHIVDSHNAKSTPQLRQEVEAAMDGSSKPQAASLPPQYLGEDREEFIRIRTLVLTARLNEGYEASLALAPKYADNPHFLMDFGAIQFFRGEYADAFNLCSKAAQIIPNAVTAFGCMGVAGVYLDKQVETINAFLTAWELMRSNDTDPFKSQVFTMTGDALEFNLLMAMKSFKRYDDCIEIGSYILDIVSVEKGGAYLAMYSMVDWSQPRLANLHAYAAKLTEQGRLDLPRDRSFIGEIRRLQQKYQHVMNPFSQCMMEAISPELKLQVLTSVLSFVSLSDKGNYRFSSKVLLSR